MKLGRAYYRHDYSQACVTFKTDPAFFDDEQDGRKPNTVRLLTAQEYKRLRRAEPELIRITDPTTGDVFVREITGIHLAGVLLGTHLVVICWEHPR